MPPTADGDSVRTVGCAPVTLIPDPVHLQKIRDAVVTTHKATISASELLNVHIRRALDHDAAVDLSCCFNANWVLDAYNEVRLRDPCQCFKKVLLVLFWNDRK
jgi:hypothetical protein